MYSRRPLMFTLFSNFILNLSTSNKHLQLDTCSLLTCRVGYDFFESKIAEWGNTADTPPVTYSGCTDKGGWFDSDGIEFNCLWYAEGTNCAYGNLSAHAGLTAKTACCACGGGNRGPMTPANPTLKPTRTPTLKPTTAKPTKKPVKIPTRKPTKKPV